MNLLIVREIFKAHGWHHVDTGILDPLITDILAAVVPPAGEPTNGEAPGRVE